MLALLWAIGIVLKFIGVIAISWPWVIFWPIPVVLLLFVIGLIFGGSMLALATAVPGRRY